MLGASIRAEVAVADGIVIVADIPHGGAMPAMVVGDAVNLRIDPRRVVILPRDSA